VTAAAGDYWWICWEDGDPIRVCPRWEADGWLRRGNYMHKSISPWADQSQRGRESIAAKVTLPLELVANVS